MGHRKLSTTFLTLSWRAKVHLLLRYCIKNLSIGGSQGTLLNLFWIFEYITDGPFAGPLSANFLDVKKVQQKTFGHLYFDFWVQNQYKGVKMYSPGNQFFVFVLVNRFLTYGWSSNFLTLDGWWIKCEFTPWMVNDRGSMSLMICRGHIRASKDVFQNFLWLTVLWQINI